MFSKLEFSKEKFIVMLIRCGVLKFGDFTTKSGRKTPYFINFGDIADGYGMYYLCLAYASILNDLFASENGPPTNSLLFGPAYKGIPLVAVTSTILYNLTGINLPFCYNRKEVKDHGEGGSLVGRKPQDGDNIILIEDVTTAGTSIRESVSLLKKIAAVNVSHLLIAADREERVYETAPTFSALKVLEGEFGIEARSILTIREIVAYLEKNKVDGKIIISEENKKRIFDYWEKYGAF